MMMIIMIKEQQVMNMRQTGEGRHGKINNLFKEDEVPGGGGGSCF